MLLVFSFQEEKRLEKRQREAKRRLDEQKNAKRKKVEKPKPQRGEALRTDQHKDSKMYKRIEELLAGSSHASHYQSSLNRVKTDSNNG